MRYHDPRRYTVDPYRITADVGELPGWRGFISDVRFWTGCLIGILLTAVIS